jgi:hypothetical protein
MPKRNPEDVLKDIEDSEVDDKIDQEIDRVLAMTPEERRKELEAAGFDINEVHAQADQLYELIQLLARRNGRGRSN